MRVFLLDPSRVAYTPASLHEEPLGASQSAVLMVAEELARSGVHVSMAGEGFPAERAEEGVNCITLTESEFGFYPGVDRVISLNRIFKRQWLREHFGESCRYLHWHQNDSLSPYGATFKDPEAWSHVDHFVFVSHFQAKDFIARFGGRVSVIGNPVPGVFLTALAEDAPILSQKDPQLLVYASAPNRGLEWLVKRFFPLLRKSRPALRLEIYSGFYLDQGFRYVNAAGDTTQRRKALLSYAATLPNITVNHGVPEDELAARLRWAAMLCYPCNFRETFCNAVREAMAAGCLISTTDVGALPETTAGFAVLTHTSSKTNEPDVPAFVHATLGAMHSRDARTLDVEGKLRRQVEWVRESSAPAVISLQWQKMLDKVLSHPSSIAEAVC